MWRRRGRIQQLENEIAQGKAERAELRRRIDWFEAIATAAGAAPPGTDPGGTGRSSTALPGTTPPSTTPPRAGQQRTVPPAPPNLLVAARDLRGHDVPVRLDVAGSEVIAVVGGLGDPQKWWTAIWQTAGPDAGPGTAHQKEAPL